MIDGTNLMNDSGRSNSPRYLRNTKTDLTMNSLGGAFELSGERDFWYIDMASSVTDAETAR